VWAQIKVSADLAGLVPKDLEAAQKLMETLGYSKHLRISAMNPILGVF
jgi:hypothetical protein